jgi:hypothetical protein
VTGRGKERRREGNLPFRGWLHLMETLCISISTPETHLLHTVTIPRSNTHRQSRSYRYTQLCSAVWSYIEKCHGFYGCQWVLLVHGELCICQSTVFNMIWGPACHNDPKRTAEKSNSNDKKTFCDTANPPKNTDAMRKSKRIQKLFNKHEQLPPFYCTSSTSAASAMTASPSSNTSITRRKPSHISSACATSSNFSALASRPR